VTAASVGRVNLVGTLKANFAAPAFARQDGEGGERRSDDTDDTATATLRPIPRYHAVAVHPVSIGTIQPDGTMGLVSGEYRRTPRVIPAARTASSPRPDRRASAAPDRSTSPRLDAEPRQPVVLDASNAVPISPDPSDAVAAELAGSISSCNYDRATLSIVGAGTAIKPPFTVTLTDLTPKAGETDPAGEVGPDGIEGHRVGKTIQLKLAVKDADGNEPTYPVAIHLAVGGSRHGTLIISGANGTVECDTASFIWHQRDAQGTLINLNDQLGYRLGTLAWIAGFVADASKPGGIAPVWTSAETLRITALGIESGGSQDQLTEQTIAVRPEAAKPDHLACWDVYPTEPCSNTFQYWTGYWSYADGTKTIGNPLETKLRVGPMQLYNAYFLYDSYGNLTYAPEASTSATQPTANVTVGFTNQVSTGPDFAGYALSTSWHNDPEMPQGQMTSTLTVSYPTDPGPTPDWQAGTVTKLITYQFDTGATKLLAQKQSYESRLGMEDGPFPLEVSPEAGPGGMPTSAAGDTPRLVLLALNGTLVKTELLEGAVEPSLEPQMVWKKDGASWIYTDDQDQSTVIETSDQPTFRLSLVDGDGEVVPEGELQAHLCPRYEHLTDGPPAPGSCTASPIAAAPGTGRIDSLTLNQPGAQRGYLGIELTKAPPKQGEYYIKVESLGPSMYRMRRQGQLTLDTHATGEHVGYFAICIVSGGEFLDGSFRRIDLFTVNQPTRSYVRYLDSTASEDTLTITVQSHQSSGAVFDEIRELTVERVGQSDVFVSHPIDLMPVWMADGGASPSRERAARQATQLAVPIQQGATATATQGNPPQPVASTRTSSGVDYSMVLGLTTRMRVYRFDLPAPFNQPVFFACNPDSGDCPQDQSRFVADDQITSWTLTPSNVEPEGPDQLARMESEPGPDPASGWYLRAIRATTVCADMALPEPQRRKRGNNGTISVAASVPGGATFEQKLEIVCPTRLGSQTDGYPVEYPAGTSQSLLTLIVDIADRYAIPPQFLMSQTNQEASKISTTPLRLNAFSYRYEPYAFDFKFISGDEPDCCESNGHKLLQAPTGNLTGYPFFVQGLSNGATPDEVEVKPYSGGGDSVTPRVFNKTLIPASAYPTALYDIAEFPGAIHWNVAIHDAQNQPAFEHSDPGQISLPQDEFKVDCRTGRIVLGRAIDKAEAEALLVDFTPSVVVRMSRPAGFAAALGSAPTTAEIIQRCPACVTPPDQLHTKISDWARLRGCSGVLTQAIERYGRPFTPYESCFLLSDDPSFDIQGQWYGGASFGLFQMWPARARDVIRMVNEKNGAEGAELLALYKPLTEPGNKLFDPRTAVRFGAAGDVYATVRAEDSANIKPYEGTCAAEARTPPFNDCTWRRWWARRFAAYNRGHDSLGSLPGTGQAQFVGYGLPIVNGGAAFVPQP
jgi:hypothetical protein